MYMFIWMLIFEIKLQEKVYFLQKNSISGAGFSLFNVDVQECSGVSIYSLWAYDHDIKEHDSKVITTCDLRSRSDDSVDQNLYRIV